MCNQSLLRFGTFLWILDRRGVDHLPFPIRESLLKEGWRLIAYDDWVLVMHHFGGIRKVCGWMTVKAQAPLATEWGAILESRSQGSSLGLQVGVQMMWLEGSQWRNFQRCLFIGDRFEIPPLAIFAPHALPSTIDLYLLILQSEPAVTLLRLRPFGPIYGLGIDLGCLFWGELIVGPLQHQYMRVNLHPTTFFWWVDFLQWIWNDFRFL